MICSRQKPNRAEIEGVMTMQRRAEVYR